jgi:hypothetical protein
MIEPRKSNLIKPELKVSLAAFAIYLALFPIAALFIYVWDARLFMESGSFFPVPSSFGLLVYSLYYLPGFWSFLVVLGWVLRYGMASLAPSRNGYLVFFILFLFAHSLYWLSASLLKDYVNRQANPVETEFEAELHALNITPIVIRDAGVNGRGFNNYVMEITVSNPLSRDVDIAIDSTTVLLRVRDNRVYQDIGTRRLLHRREIAAGYEGTLQLKISNSTMGDIFEANGYMPLIVELDMQHSVEEIEKLNRMIDISHALCRWSVFGCPDYGGSYGFGPFSDNKVWNKAYQVRANYRLELVDFDIFQRISDATYEFEPVNPRLRGLDS